MGYQKCQKTMIPIYVCIVHIKRFHRQHFFQNKRLALALRKRDVEVAEKCLSLGADVNYMEVRQDLYMVSSISIVIVFVVSVCFLF